MCKSIVWDIPVRMNECAPDERLRPHILFDYLQQIAAMHAEKLGFGMTAIRENKLIWILSRIKLHVDKYPRFDDTVRLETYHNGTEKIFAKRQFVWKSATTGESFGYGSSFWLCLDTQKLRPRPPVTALNMEETVNADRQEFFPMLDKLPPIVTDNPILYDICASQIDLNNHLNNTYYCEYAMDWIARATGKIVRFTEIQINFNRAMQFGEKLKVSGALDENKFYVEGVETVDGKNSFQASGVFEEIGTPILKLG